jgi:hypothetical protein
MGAISELQAINHMLEAAGESLVADLDGSSGTDTTFAQQVLDRYRRDYQLRGISVNQFSVEIYPDANGRLYLPTADEDDDGIIDAELHSSHTNADGYAIYARVQGRTQPKLYNVTDDTDIWDTTKKYRIQYTKLLKWDNLPTTLQRAIMASAARRYQATVMGDAEADMFFAQEEELYWQLFKAEDTQDRRANLFLNGPEGMRKLHPRNRGRFRDPNEFRFWRGTTS